MQTIGVPKDLDLKKGVTDVNEFHDIGRGKAKVNATNLVNNSKIPLHNELTIRVQGKKVSTGHMSYSSIFTMRQCGKKYELQYVKKERPRSIPKIPMWVGVRFHAASEELIRDTMAGKPHALELFVKNITEGISEEIADYKKTYERDMKEKLDPVPFKLDPKIGSEEALLRLWSNAGKQFYTEMLPTLNPISVEKFQLCHFDVGEKLGGGTIPIVGFTDVENKIGKNLEILDIKCGKAKDDSTLQRSLQLRLYTLMTGINDVGILNVSPGTTGGQRPQNAKPGKVFKLSKKNTIKDSVYLHEEIRATLAKIKHGIYQRTEDFTICDPDRCPYYYKCQV